MYGTSAIQGALQEHASGADAEPPDVQRARLVAIAKLRLSGWRPIASATQHGSDPRFSVASEASDEITPLLNPFTRPAAMEPLAAQEKHEEAARDAAGSPRMHGGWRPRLDLGFCGLAREWRRLLTSTAGLRSDLQAAVIVGFVSIPLSLAIAMGVGMSPEVGLLTAIVGALVASLAGGTPLAVSGPAAAIVATCFSVYTSFGAAGVVLVTGAAGLLQARPAPAAPRPHRARGGRQVLAGALGLGGLARFVPVPVIAGFTGGIGITVLVQQIPAALSLPKPPSSHAAAVLLHVWRSIAQANLHSGALAAVTVLCILGLPRLPYLGRLPATLTSVVALTVACALARFPVPSIGKIPSALPAPSVPDFAFVTAGNAAALFGYAVVVFGIASVESLLSSSACDRLAKGRARRHDPSQELIGQGLANLAASAFGGMPVSSVIVRSSLNIQSGATSRRAGVALAAILVFVVYALAPVMSFIPMPVLSGVLLTVAIRMLSPREPREILAASRVEGVAWFVTLATVAVADVMTGVAVGLVVAVVTVVVRRQRGPLAVTVAPATTFEHACATAAGPAPPLAASPAPSASPPPDASVSGGSLAGSSRGGCHSARPYATTAFAWAPAEPSLARAHGVRSSASVSSLASGPLDPSLARAHGIRSLASVASLASGPSDPSLARAHNIRSATSMSSMASAASCTPAAWSARNRSPSMDLISSAPTSARSSPAPSLDLHPRSLVLDAAPAAGPKLPRSASHPVGLALCDGHGSGLDGNSPVDYLQLAGSATFLSSGALATFAEQAAALADAEGAGGAHRPALVDLSQLAALDISGAQTLLEAVGGLMDAGKAAVIVGASGEVRALIEACDHEHRVHPAGPFVDSLGDLLAPDPEQPAAPCKLPAVDEHGTGALPPDALVIVE